MVGFFPQLSGYSRPHPSFLDTNEDQVGDRDGAGEMDFHGNIGSGGKIVLEFGAEFKPVEHPIEPEEDQPVKCPMIDSSLLKKDEGIWKELFAEGLQKGAETLVVAKVTTADEPPVQAVHSRHHTVARGSDNPPSTKAPQHNFFSVFQQCREFEF